MYEACSTADIIISCQRGISLPLMILMILGSGRILNICRHCEVFSCASEGLRWCDVSSDAEEMLDLLLRSHVPNTYMVLELVALRLDLILCFYHYIVGRSLIMEFEKHLMSTSKVFQFHKEDHWKKMMSGQTNKTLVSNRLCKPPCEVLQVQKSKNFFTNWLFCPVGMRWLALSLYNFLQLWSSSSWSVVPVTPQRKLYFSGSQLYFYAIWRIKNKHVMLHLKCTFSLTSTQGKENKGLYFLKARFNLKGLRAQV